MFGFIYVTCAGIIAQVSLPQLIGSETWNYYHNLDDRLTQNSSPDCPYNKNLSCIHLRKNQMRHHHYITFFSLNRFCPFSNPHPLTPPFFLMATSSWNGYQPKLNEKYMPFLKCILSFEGTS